MNGITGQTQPLLHMHWHKTKKVLCLFLFFSYETWKMCFFFCFFLNGPKVWCFYFIIIIIIVILQM